MCPDRGGDPVAIDPSSEVTDTVEDGEDERSYFARGAVLGLVGGVLAAIMIMSAAGSVLSLVDDVFGSSTAAVAEPDEQLPEDDSLVAAGAALAASTGCVGCHSADGIDGVGPTWSGLAGRVDQEYIQRSIVDPSADIAAGFADGLMPAAYRDLLTDDDLDALVAYISSL